MADVVANGVRLHVQRVAPRNGGAGPAPTAVLLHGWLVDNLASFYHTLAFPLSAAGIEAVMYDQRGHGLSERPPSGYGMDDSVADLAALLDALELEQPVHLVGNSHGSALALTFAIEHPERVASLALIEAHLPDGPWKQRAGVAFLERRREFARGVAPDIDLPRYVRSHVRGRLAAQLEALVTQTTLREDQLAMPTHPAEALAEIRCPVWAFYGGRGELVEYGHWLASAKAELVSATFGVLVLGKGRAGLAVRKSARSARRICRSQSPASDRRAGSD